VDSSPRFGDRSGYQLGFGDHRLSLEYVSRDIKQKADIVMVKPALGYLDIVRRVRDRFNHPLAVYNVSGEYWMVKAGAKRGFWNEKKMVAEIIASIRRAGADFIITYHAADIASGFVGS